MIIILGVTYSSFKNQGVASRSDNSHFQCVVSMIGIGYQGFPFKKNFRGHCDPQVVDFGGSFSI